MIQILQKPYQVVLWETEDRDGAAPALQADFDTLDEARHAFATNKKRGQYRSGLLIVWDKTLSEHSLIDRFP